MTSTTAFHSYRNGIPSVTHGFCEGGFKLQIVCVLSSFPYLFMCNFILFPKLCMKIVSVSCFHVLAMYFSRYGHVLFTFGHVLFMFLSCTFHAMVRYFLCFVMRFSGFLSCTIHVFRQKPTATRTIVLALSFSWGGKVNLAVIIIEEKI